MLCCGSCFGYEFLKVHVGVKSSLIGNCNFCPSQGVPLIRPELLADLFNPVVDLYRRLDTDGQSLVALLRDDWNMFDEVSDDKACEILRHVFGDPDFIFDCYEPINEGVDGVLVKWDEFRQELQHDNRFFPDSFPNIDELSSLLSYLSVQTNRELNVLYRARLNPDSSTQHLIEDMGAPPPERATAGRANPFGISYLYVASTEKTALSELRPHSGDYYTVADYKLGSGLKLIDLRNPRITVSPFRYSDEEIKKIHSGIGLLVKLGEELAKPVSQSKAQLEYLSSQYLCEFIKSQGYEGVIYKSSLGDGDNFAIFDNAHLRGVRTRAFRVTGVEIIHVPHGVEVKPVEEEPEAIV